MSNATTAPEEEAAWLAGARDLAASALIVGRLMQGVPESLAQTRSRLVLVSAVTREEFSTALSSTEWQQLAPEMKARLDGILAAAKSEVFEDGMPNVVTEQLRDLVVESYSSIVPAVSALIESGQLGPVVSAEVLKDIGRYRDASSHALRLWLLEDSLFSSEPATRDGAGLGLARLGDTDAISYLESAIARESDPSLREDLRLVLGELRETDAGPASGDQ